jgi:hypothetical protein
MESVYYEHKVYKLRTILGVGTSYYFRSASPSLYINVGTGFFPAYMGGIGYEFAPHWSFEVGITHEPERGYMFSHDMDVFAISLSIIGIAY